MHLAVVALSNFLAVFFNLIHYFGHCGLKNSNYFIQGLVYTLCIWDSRMENRFFQDTEYFGVSFRAHFKNLEIEQAGARCSLNFPESFDYFELLQVYGEIPTGSILATHKLCIACMHQDSN